MSVEPRRTETPGGAAEAPDIQIFADGDAARHNVDYALRRLEPVIGDIEEPVLFAGVRLLVSSNPAQERPAQAEVIVDINGDQVRAQVADESMTAAIDMLKDRLLDQLKHRSERRKARRRRPPAGPSWRRGDLPGHRPNYFDRPVHERELVRRKTYSIGETTPEEAVADMEQLDHDFFLFREAPTGEVAVVFRQNGSYGLLRQNPDNESEPMDGIELAKAVPPRLSVEEAIDRIGVTDEKFLFFVDEETDAGSVLYRRYDGHYGLIVPS